MSAGSTSQRGSSRDWRAERLLAGPAASAEAHPNPVSFLLGLDGRLEDRSRPTAEA
jgi:hypothetical protein